MCPRAPQQTPALAAYHRPRTGPAPAILPPRYTASARCSSHGSSRHTSSPPLSSALPSHSRLTAWTEHHRTSQTTPLDHAPTQPIKSHKSHHLGHTQLPTRISSTSRPRPSKCDPLSSRATATYSSDSPPPLSLPQLCAFPPPCSSQSHQLLHTLKALQQPQYTCSLPAPTSPTSSPAAIPLKPWGGARPQTVGSLDTPSAVAIPLLFK